MFNAIKDDLAHVYTLSYYPRPNPNQGWRTIKVKLVGPNSKNLNIRTRNGYRPSRTTVTADLSSGSVNEGVFQIRVTEGKRSC